MPLAQPFGRVGPLQGFRVHGRSLTLRLNPQPCSFYCILQVIAEEVEVLNAVSLALPFPLSSPADAADGNIKEEVRLR